MKYRPAFTLLEIILVITIVAIMAMLAVGSYGSARLRAKLDLTADLLVSTVKQRQSLAKSGKSLNCYGVVFDTKAEEGEMVQLVEAPYVAVSGNTADVCDFTDPMLTVFDEMENFKIASIEESKIIDGIGQEVESVALVFKPPQAKLLLGLNLDNLSPPSQSLVVKITVAPPSGTDSRMFVFDSISGVTKRLTTEVTP